MFLIKSTVDGKAFHPAHKWGRDLYKVTDKPLSVSDHTHFYYFNLDVWPFEAKRYLIGHNFDVKVTLTVR